MFEKQFDLRYFEMGQDGEASPVTILTLLEEAAADHCLAIGHSLYDLLEKGIGWVLLSGRMIMERYPEYKEKITIGTWLSNIKTFRGIRENIIFDEQGEIIGKAKGLWLFFDIKKRRPARIFDDILKKWTINIINNCYLHAIDGHFVAEAQYGHTIESLAEPDDRRKTFIHTIRDLDSRKVCSTARTVWKERKK
ncbi:MAG TPA: acyl-ACP thioesterase domain-containing protein [Balneolaceae bacterium]